MRVIVFSPGVPNECWVMAQECDVGRAAAILKPIIERMGRAPPLRGQPSSGLSAIWQ
jgi:hypothetical protein